MHLRIWKLQNWISTLMLSTDDRVSRQIEFKRLINRPFVHRTRQEGIYWSTARSFQRLRKRGEYKDRCWGGFELSLGAPIRMLH